METSETEENKVTEQKQSKPVSVYAHTTHCSTKPAQKQTQVHRRILHSHQISTRCTLKNRNTHKVQTCHTTNTVLTINVTEVPCTEHSPAQCRNTVNALPCPVPTELLLHYIALQLVP